MSTDILIRDYLPLGILILVASFIVGIVPILAHSLGPRRHTEVKDMPYESGMRPIGPATRRLPVRFYLVAVLFILFDIEVIFMIPWAVAFRSQNPPLQNIDFPAYLFFVMLPFLFVLLLGFIYEWKRGALTWD